MALARAVEAMQRVQAERERVQAEMFAKIIERLTPAPPQPALDLRNAVTQVLDLQKALREAMVSEDDGDEGDGDQAWWSSPAFAQMIGTVLPVLMRWMTGPSGKEAPPRIAPRNRPAPAEATTAECKATEEAPKGAGELTAKMEAVLARLEPEERAQVVAALPLLPCPVRAQVEAVIAASSVEEAVGALREYLAVARRAGGKS